MGRAGLVVGRKELAMGIIAAGEEGQLSLSRLDDDFRCGLDLAIPQTANHFQDFAPGREWSAAAALVGIHGIHEFDFVVRIVTLASGRINFASTLGFAAWVAGAAFDTIWRRSLRREAAAVGNAAALAQTLFDDLIHFQSGGHSRLREGKTKRTDRLKKGDMFATTMSQRCESLLDVELCHTTADSANCADQEGSIS